MAGRDYDSTPTRPANPGARPHVDRLDPSPRYRHPDDVAALEFFIERHGAAGWVLADSLQLIIQSMASSESKF